MRITILGSGGGVGIPNMFCQCANCEAARAAGGRSLRNGPAVLINDDLLVDCGPDVVNSVRQLGLNLSSVQTLAITHRHGDHLDPWFFWARRGVRDTELPLLTVYAPQDVLDEVFSFYQSHLQLDRKSFESLTRTIWRPVHAGMMKLAGAYRLNFFPATHGEGLLEAVLVGVSDARAAYFHCYDTGPLSEDAWAMLSGHRFDVAALDACIGLQDDYESAEHMTGPQTVAHAHRMRETGILKPGGAALATHFVHQAAGRHEDLVAYYEPQGLTVAYDGLVLMPGE